MHALVHVVDIVSTPKLKYEARVRLCGERVNFYGIYYVESILVKSNFD